MTMLESSGRGSHNVEDDGLEAIENATLSVPAETLAASGIQNVRVLSESRFVDIVQRLVAETVRREVERAENERGLGAGGDPPPLGDGSPGAPPRLAPEEWNRIRSGLLAGLDRFDERLDRVEVGFQRIRRALRRLQSCRTAEPTVGPLPRFQSAARGLDATHELRHQLMRRALARR